MTEPADLTSAQIDQMPPGHELDTLVAEKVLGVAKPTDQVHASHLDPVFYGAYWHCSPGYDEGDVCEWRPIPFSTDLRAAWEVVEKLEPLVCRFETADGFIHLECGHWADHGECAQSAYADPEGEDPAPWSFHMGASLELRGSRASLA
jgi:hypothetical protein